MKADTWGRCLPAKVYKHECILYATTDACQRFAILASGLPSVCHFTRHACQCKKCGHNDYPTPQLTTHIVCVSTIAARHRHRHYRHSHMISPYSRKTRAHTKAFMGIIHGSSYCDIRSQRMHILRGLAQELPRRSILLLVYPWWMHPGEMEVLCRLRGDRAETEPPSRIQEG